MCKWIASWKICLPIFYVHVLILQLWPYLYNPYILEFKQTRKVHNNAVNPFKIQG